MAAPRGLILIQLPDGRVVRMPGHVDVDVPAGAGELLTFAEKVEPTVQACRTILERHGAERVNQSQALAALRRRPGQYHFPTGYLLPAPVADGSEVDYALKILTLITQATTATDQDTASKNAWDAAQLIFDAHATFARKKTLLHQAFKAGQVHRAKAMRRKKGANQWQKKVESRRVGRTKGSVYAEIEGLEDLKPGTVKKALQRRKKRLTAP